VRTAAALLASTAPLNPNHNRCARAAAEKAESDGESFRAVALDCMSQYVAARRQFVAACSQVQEQQQHRASDDASPASSHLQQLYAKCDELVSTAHSHCDQQLKAWQQQRAQLSQAHAQSMQQLQACLARNARPAPCRGLMIIIRPGCRMRYLSGIIACDFKADSPLCHV
jgi:hypothetical protein